MRTSPIIATKLRTPEARAGLVERPRLLTRLRESGRARLTVVSGPAGFGKTTLVGEWARQTPSMPGRVAWLSLDPRDDDVAGFWSAVIAALRTVRPDLDASLNTILGSAASPAGTPTSSGPITDAVVLLVNDLAAAPEPVWLVLDDYHVITDPAVVAGMSLLVEHLPATVHLVITTRVDPDLPLARWRVRGELVEIRAAELRFTPQETAALLDTAGLLLAPADVTVLAERTEGWAAALALAVLSLRDRPDRAGFIASFGGGHRYVVDYLTEEVLAHQPPEVRDFLLQTSVLDRLTGPLCDAITGRDDGAQMLVAAEPGRPVPRATGRPAPVVPLSPALRRRAARTVGGGLARSGRHPALQSKCLVCRARHPQRRHPSPSATPSDIDADTDDAVAHALAGGDAARAAYLLEAALPRARTDRREGSLTRWLDRLPPRVVAGSPVLTMLGAHRLLTRGELTAAEDRLTHAERTLATPRAPGAQPWADTVELRTLPASIEVYRGAVALARGDLPGTTAHAQRALELAAPTDHLSRGSAQGFLAMAAWAAGELSAAIEAATHAAASLGCNGNRVDELSLTVVLAELHTAQGHPSRARQLCERALAAAQAEGAPVAKATAELHLALGELDHADGRLDSARAHLDSAAALFERLPVSEGRHRWFEAMSRVRLSEGDPDEAHALLTEAERLFTPGFFPDLRPIAAQRARLWIRAGQLGHAQAWARSAGGSPSGELPSPGELPCLGEMTYLGEYAALTSVRLLLAQGRASADRTPVREALAHLERLHAAATAGARASSLLEIGVLQALALDTLGGRQPALACLGAALLAWPDPTIPAGRLLDEGRWLLDLLRAAPAGGALGERARQVLARGIPERDEPERGIPERDEPERSIPERDEPGTPRAPRRSSETGPPEPTPAAHTAAPLIDPLSARELQVLRLLDTELTGPELARHLFVLQHRAHPHQAHLHQARGHHEAGRGAARSRARSALAGVPAARLRARSPDRGPLGSFSNSAVNRKLPKAGSTGHCSPLTRHCSPSRSHRRVMPCGPAPT